MRLAFVEIMKQVQAKAPRAMAEMAHYVHVKHDAGIPEKLQGAADALFTWIECTTPPPKHPVKPSTLTMSFKLEIGGDAQSFWMGEDGVLTDDPEKAIAISLAWSCSTPERDRLRKLSYAGVKSLRELAISLGVPQTFIRSNP